MERFERTEVYGQHVISATACRAAGTDPSRRWELRVSAIPRGGNRDAPLLRVPVVQQDQDDPADALDAALQEARRVLSRKAAT
jgi:hypothetical protein